MAELEKTVEFFGKEIKLKEMKNLHLRQVIENIRKDSDYHDKSYVDNGKWSSDYNDYHERKI